MLSTKFSVVTPDCVLWGYTKDFPVVSKLN